MRILILWIVLAGRCFGAEADLSADDLAQLKRDKIFVTNVPYKQVFTPYIDSETPVFITSDAVLNAFNVLFQESVQKLEERQSLEMGDFLMHLWTGLPGVLSTVRPEGELKEAGRRQAMLFLGVAMKLLGLPAPELGDELQAVVDAEVKKIEAATGVGKPGWMEKDDAYPLMDYSRFQPRGIYSESTHLKRYFRCVVWMQTFSFRIENDTDLLAAILLAKPLFSRSLSPYSEFPPRIEDFLLVWRSFFGRPDNLSIVELAEEIVGYDEILVAGELYSGLKGVAEKMNLLAKAREAPVNDMITKSSDTNSIRILGAARLMDAVLFEATTDWRKVPAREFPSGLEVAAALGCELAEDFLVAKAEPQHVIDEVRNAKEHWAQKRSVTIYESYMRCLSKLVDAPDADAPEFMRSDAWQRKSCGSALAGWAQMRRTWVLQAKSNSYMSASKIEPGFVEPDPEFFGQLRDLSLSALSQFSEVGAFDETIELIGLDQVVDSLIMFCDFCRTVGDNPKLLFDDIVTPEIEKAATVLFKLAPRSGASKIPDRYQAATKITAWMTERAASADVSLVTLQGDDDGEKAKLLRKLKAGNGYGVSIHRRWIEFIRLVSQLESLAVKQLRQIPFNDDEKKLITDFGKDLAMAMFYDSNAYVAPKDNAMKVVDVFAGERQHLHVGISRPRKMYVLYPWQGKEILCVGAVTPYMEFTSAEVVDDVGWKAMLDGAEAERPAVPEWYAPLLGKEGFWGGDLEGGD
jgi:hypothetical protein